MSLWAYKKQREIMRRMDIYRGEWASCHPPFPVTSLAANVEVDEAIKNVEDIEYSPEDDKIIEQWLRENVQTTWHSMGTCKMAPREEKGVVDPSLGVYGVEALKIADLSIAPDNVAANTAGTAFAIGEKAADIFIKELRLGQYFFAYMYPTTVAAIDTDSSYKRDMSLNFCAAAMIALV